MTESKDLIFSVAKAKVPKDTYLKYTERCKKEFDNQRSGHLPIIKFINAFANYEIDLDDLTSRKFQTKK
jgi:hypothetical protein